MNKKKVAILIAAGTGMGADAAKNLSLKGRVKIEVEINKKFFEINHEKSS